MNATTFAISAVAYAAEDRIVRRVLAGMRRFIADDAAYQHAKESAEHAARHFLRMGPGCHPLWAVASYYAQPDRLGPISDDALDNATRRTLRRIGPCIIDATRDAALNIAWATLSGSASTDFQRVAERMRRDGGADHLPAGTV